jgi:molecular chaperone DnaK (HSP70)
MNKEASYIIGIDFGTTNCTLAYTLIPNNQQLPVIEQASLAQIVAAQTQGASLSLPSFIYYPLQEELAQKISAIEWDLSSNFTIGTFARERGAELPNRLVQSAKSWLCHNHIDRRQAILPFDSEEVVSKVSPLDACAEIFRHLRQAWDVNKPEARFIEQNIFVTVPASFDPSARQLIQEAANLAGYPEIILLEEPQAAFYGWLYTHADNWRNLFKINETILVIDIGGGTTDFSLIKVEEEQGNLVLRRLAVGSHLLLGGDNIDLGLAHFAKQKLEEDGHFIDDWQLKGLVHQARKAKELLMGENPSETVDLTILGRGSKLIGNTLKTSLSQKEIETFVLEGFVPFVSPEEKSLQENRSGIQQVGLPYAQDPRITCQLAKFLSMTGESETTKMDQFVLPNKVLFNGGTLKAKLLREKLLQQLNEWALKLDKSPVEELHDADYDYAVSKGAAYYGIARLGHTIRIRGGTSRSYFIGVEEAVPAVPGINPPLRAICIAPFGMEEGEERELNQQEFALVLGEMATFRFFSHSTPQLSNGVEPQAGTIVRNWKQELTELHPIETVLNKSGEDGKTVLIKLKSKVTELGVLELWCAAADGRKWKLEFDVRNPV